MNANITAEQHDDFVRGFAAGMGLDQSEDSRREADEAWAAHSRQLSDADIRREEALGFDRGLELGREYAAL